MSAKGSSKHIFELQNAHLSSPTQSNSSFNACEAFGINLKKIRDRLGLPLGQVAASLGISEEHLARIEAGISDQVDFEFVVKLKHAFDLKYLDILQGIT